ncbi:MAG: radical SAM family heme chaperone HemW [Eubacterium sp.]|nr:radical SAM family heme chaperone HemW [Eubacterium sp.]
MNKVGLYIHVPFCLSKCPYCDFYSVKYDDDTAKGYLNAVKANLANYDSIRFDTVYFGGGTPILLWKEICEILSFLGDRIEPDAEITLEANPCCTHGEALTALKQSGVNRVSFGLQSADDNELKALGRRHNATQGEQAVEMCYNAGVENISADIMLGIPLQTPESLKRTVERFTSLPITHISAYMLKIEENTPFATRQLDLPDEDGYAQMYLDTVSLLPEKGFTQYEISNFAKSGCECRHNLKYWRCEEYIGIGPAAHSFYNGSRYAVNRDLSEFIKIVPQRTYVTEGSPADFDEWLMLRLRLSEGVDLDEVKQRFGIEKEKLFEKLKAVPTQLYRADNNNIRLTPEGFLVSNAVIGILTDI